MSSKLAVLCLFGVAISMVSGCSSMMKKSHLTADGSLSSEAMTITARPREFGLEMIGDAEGSAATEKFLFFTIGGDKAGDVSMPVYGNKSKSGLETLACYRAARSQDGDAFYSVSTEWDKQNVLGIYRKYSVKVKGKVLRLSDLGDLSEERADGTYEAGQKIDIDFSAKAVPSK